MGFLPGGWIADLFGYKDVLKPDSSVAIRRKALRFLSSVVTDNAALGTTDIALALAVTTGLLWVDAAAPDGGNGSQGLPMNSIQAAHDALPGTGGHIYLATGTYAENITVTKSCGFSAQPGANRLLPDVTLSGNIHFAPTSGSACAFQNINATGVWTATTNLPYLILGDCVTPDTFRITQAGAPPTNVIVYGSAFSRANNYGASNINGQVDIVGRLQFSRSNVGLTSIKCALLRLDDSEVLAVAGSLECIGLSGENNGLELYNRCLGFSGWTINLSGVSNIVKCFDQASARTLEAAGATITAAGGVHAGWADREDENAIVAAGGATATVDFRKPTTVTPDIGPRNQSLVLGVGATPCVLTFVLPLFDCTMGLDLIQDGTGNRSVTWPASVKMPVAGAPTLSTGAGKRDRFRLEKRGAVLYLSTKGLGY